MIKQKSIFNAILLICLLLISPEMFAKSTIFPINLKLEYMVNPKGLDRPVPRFSWTLETFEKDQFGLKQTAYRILVASSEKELKSLKGDVWDSGWVSSSEMSQINYMGSTLLSDQTYYWKVMVKDQNQKESKWSEAASWTTGLFMENLWEAKWIGAEKEFDPTAADCNIWDPWLRKIFDLDKVGKKANLYVASIGYHEVYVNGVRLGQEVLAPTVTDHTKRARYVQYDIAPLLKKGKNVIAIWLGTSWSIFPGYDVDGSRPLLPMVSAQVSIYPGKKLNEDAILKLKTDASWRYQDSPNKLLGSWDFWKMGGELWDDRKREDHWNTAEFNDSTWNHAKEYNLNLKISASNTHGNIIGRELKPKSIQTLDDGNYRVDMGENFAGWTRVKVRGRQGDTIQFLYSERENEQKTFNLHSAFIIGESGEGEFKNHFNYSSGRWITIKGLKEKPKPEDIQGWSLRTGFKNASTFESSDPLQNWIYDRIKWTFENLSIGGFIVDCPQRERMGYGGDAHATAETGMMNYQLGAFYYKWMEDWRDVQGTEPMVGNMRDKNYARTAMTSGRIFDNGVLPHTAPTYWGGGGPAWGGIVVSLPYFMYRQYGDKQVLKENYEMMKRWLEFLDSHVENGILKRFGGQWDFLGDWLWPNATSEGMNNDKMETLALNNSYRVFNLRTAAKIARVLGDEPQAKDWERKANISAEAIHEKFYHPSSSTYADGSMANLAAALLSEIVPESELEKVKLSLENEIMVRRKGHIHAGITGGALLFKWLRTDNRNDLIYSMTSKQGYPSWGYMKNNGATTIWEMWEKDLPGHSLLHSSYLYPGSWMIDGIGGIKPLEPGYRTFIIQPPLPQDSQLTWANTSFDSPVGRITNNWKRIQGQLMMDIHVPVNSKAILKVSKHENIDVGKYKEVVKELPTERNYRVYELESGTYRF